MTGNIFLCKGRLRRGQVSNNYVTVEMGTRRIRRILGLGSEIHIELSVHRLNTRLDLACIRKCFAPLFMKSSTGRQNIYKEAGPEMIYKPIPSQRRWHLPART